MKISNLWDLASQAIVVTIPDETPKASFACGVMGSADCICWVAMLVLGETTQSWADGTKPQASCFAAPRALEALATPRRLIYI